MRLRRFLVCPSSTVGWQSIATDEYYNVEKCTADAPRTMHNALFRIRTRSTPSLMVATGMTLPEILHDWNGLCGYDAAGMDQSAAALHHNRLKLSAEQIATFVQVGSAISMVQYALLNPLQNICGLVLLCYAYGKGLTWLAILLWTLFCLLKNRSSSSIVAAIQSQHAYNLNLAAQVAGKCSTILEAIVSVVTSENPLVAYIPCIVLLAFSVSTYPVVSDPSWQPALQTYSPALIFIIIYSGIIFIAGQLAPHVIPSLGWPDPLHLLFCGVKSASIPKTYCSLDWSAAIPVHPMDWAALADDAVAQAASAEASAHPPKAPMAQEKAETAETAASATSLTSDKLEDILEEIDRLANTGREAAQCLVLLNKAQSLYPDTAEVLWRFCRAYDELFVQEPNLKKREEMTKKGVEAATRAVELEPNNAATYRWKGIMFGRSVDFMGVKEKVATGAIVRDSFQKALDLDPNAGYCLFCMGSWYLAVAELSWVERKAAKMIFNDFPENPYGDAMALFEKAETLVDPKFVVPVQNLLSLAKCYIGLKQKDKAKQTLQKAVDHAATRPDELKAKEEAAKLLRSL